MHWHENPKYAIDKAFLELPEYLSKLEQKTSQTQIQLTQEQIQILKTRQFKSSTNLQIKATLRKLGISTIQNTSIYQIPSKTLREFYISLIQKYL